MIVARKNSTTQVQCFQHFHVMNQTYLFVFFFILHDLVLGYILCVIELSFMQML